MTVRSGLELLNIFGGQSSLLVDPAELLWILQARNCGPDLFNQARPFCEFVLNAMPMGEVTAAGESVAYG